MVLTPYDWIYGIAQSSAAFLSIGVAILSISLFRISFQKKVLRAWAFLLFALLLFVAEEIFGALKTFGIVTKLPFITHIIPSVILGLLITSLIIQINVNRGWMK